jgi:hypothetical protein
MRTMNRVHRALIVAGLFGICATARAMEDNSVLVLSESDFPVGDSATPSNAQLEALLPHATFARAADLPARLESAHPQLLVLPYGSVFPEKAWPAIHRFLQAGGNLLTIGGQPFTRAAFHDDTGWHLRPTSVRFIRALGIDQYQPTSGSADLDFLSNPDVPMVLPRFEWRSAHSLVIRLSAVDLYKRPGSAGSLDARLDTLAWGTRGGVKVAAPIVEVDHLKNGFDGGRWIFVSADLPPEFWTGAAASVVGRLVERARDGAEAFTVRPELPLYTAGETVRLEVAWRTRLPDAVRPILKVVISSDAGPRTELTARLPLEKPIAFPAPAQPGLHGIEAELMLADRVTARYRSGFWMRDEAFLRSGPRLSVDADYFQLDGKPLAVMGTTHMSSEVQRLFFEHPNVAVWERDLAHIRAAGLTMIRTGWWTGWDKICDGEGVPHERALRTLEAYLMTARRHGLPVQLNFFAFVPDVLGGSNPYLDPEAVRRQQTLVGKVVARFRDVPFLAWDLINEPSFSTRLWTTRPNGDAVETTRWNQWLSRRYPDKALLASLWNLPQAEVQGTVSLPDDQEFSARGVYVGRNSLKVHDYFLFAQETFTAWAQGLRDRIRSTGSRQLVTVGQDEGGIQDRLSPAYWSAATDFTTNHSWWQNDALLWDSLAAKQPGQPMLIQETGLQRELHVDEVARRSLDSEAALLERKLALSFVRGAGAIQWLWHSNAYMTESNETPIGALRSDGTEKPEAGVMRTFATFAAQLSPYLRDLAPARVAVVTSQAAQFSAFADLQIEAQRKAVRALAYHAHEVPTVVAENRLSSLADIPLAILPSPQALTDDGWRTLLGYVERGGTLLVTGPVERDEHWQLKQRAASLGLSATVRPLTYRGAELRLPKGPAVPLSFEQQKQGLLDALVLADGGSLKEIRHGKGRIFWAADPVELAEGTEAAARLYRYVLSTIGLESRFELRGPNLPPGVLVGAVPLGDHVLYVFASDHARDARIDLTDKPTGARLTLTLASEHAALAIVDGRRRTIVARYGF